MARIAVRRFTRQRMLAIAGVAAATLALGGLTACGEEDKPESGGTSDAGAAGDGAETEETEETEGTAETEGSEEETEPAEQTGEEGGESGDDGVFAAGETAVYDSGLEITLSAAEPYTPSEYAIGHTEGNAPYTFTVTLENTGAESIDATFVLATARAGADGVTAEEIYDDSVGGGFMGEVLPGRSATAQYAFDTPADAETLEIQIEQGLDFETSPAVWELGL